MGVSWPRDRFWARQAVNIIVALIATTATISIWFDERVVEVTQALGNAT